MSMHHDDVFDHVPVPDRRMGLRIAGQVASVGAIVGALEGAALAVRGRLPGDVRSLAELLGASIVLGMALAFAIGLGTGFASQVALRARVRWRRYQVGFTTGVMSLLAFHLVPVARSVFLGGQRLEGFGVLGLLALLVLTTWYNAGYWYRRELIGAGVRLGVRLVAAGVTIVVTVVAVLAGGPRAPKAAIERSSRPDLVLVTVDTLRRDHVGAYGGGGLTPRIDQLGREGFVVEDAATSVPETAPSHASMLTGMQPAAHGVIANGMRLRRGYRTVAEQLALAGYRNGAFVGSHALHASTGLDQGFEVYDDVFAPHAAGAVRTRVVELGIRAFFRLGRPERASWLLERRAPDTLARALAWVDQLGDDPLFLWVHLFEPHSPYEAREGDRVVPAPVDHRAILGKEPGYPYTAAEREGLRSLYAEEVRYTDGQVGALVDALRERGRLRGGLVVVAGDHGESLGEHGLNFNHHGLYDEVLRVPLVVWSDAPTWPRGTRVREQVSVDSVANTLLGWAGMALDQSTSRQLTTVAAGAEIEPVPLLLTGRETASLADGPIVGLRTTNQLKYLRRPDGSEELYDLETDAQEALNLAPSRPHVLASCRAILEAAPPLPAGETMGDRTLLEALGYME